ncbi:MAG: AAA family ATPase, partial [Clostridia bacterium]|nr:AAA family ATPase [Clostridia bacterium]
TIPYKEAVIPYLDELDESARSIGAVNTIANCEGRLIGYNTDLRALRNLIRRNGMDLRGEKVLVLGSGGTCKTAMAVAKSLESGEIYGVSRTGRDGCITYDEMLEKHRDAAYLINTTPCGMYPHIGNSAVNVKDFTGLKGVVDAVYNPLRSRLVCDAREAGIPAVGGLYMLVAQAAYAAEIFTGQAVPSSKVDTVYHQLAAEKQNIVLVGMPGCGKTTVGRELADKLGMDFLDTDEEIERQTGRAVQEIFSTEGESAFRDIEERIVHQVSARLHTVIATGGGVILREENCRILRENGVLYFLDRPLDQLLPTDDRPLSSTREALEMRYTERYPLYCRCCDRHIHVQSVEQTIMTIQRDVTHEDFGDKWP